MTGPGGPRGRTIQETLGSAPPALKGQHSGYRMRGLSMLSSLQPLMPFRHRSTGLRFLTLVLLLTLVVACDGGAKAPDFEVPTFGGEQFRLSEHYKDNVVVINFWYPSCPPCRDEMPEFQRAWEELDEEHVTFLGLFVPRALTRSRERGTSWKSWACLSSLPRTERRPSPRNTRSSTTRPRGLSTAEGRVAETYVSTLDAEGIIGIVRELLEG